MEPVLAFLHDGQAAMEAGGEIVHGAALRQIVSPSVQDSGGGVPAGDGMLPGVAVIGPGQRLPEGRGDGLLPLQLFPESEVFMPKQLLAFWASSLLP